MAEEQPADHDFAARMRQATSNIPDFTDYATSLQDYALLADYQTMKQVREKLFIFYRIFAFLEDAKERLKMPEMDKLFVHESLFKKKAFENDLTYHLGEKEKWQDMFNDGRVQKYLEHLEKLEREDPKRLLAYVYNLYYALLRGGLILNMKRKLSSEIFNDIPLQENIDIDKEINDITKDMTEEEKIRFLAQAYSEFKKKNVKEFHTDKMMECTGDELPLIRFSEALNEITKCFTGDEKMALLDECEILYGKNCMYNHTVITVMDFTDADISQIKKDFRAAMNEIAEGLTRDEKMALLEESHNIFEMNYSLVKKWWWWCCIL